MTRFPWPCFLMVPLALVACESDELACDASAMASVTLSVVDAEGEPVAPTSLTYSIDGGEEREADCMDGDCSTAVAGWEEPGEFLIIASYEAQTEDPCCWYSDYVSATVTVEAGECHVDTQALEIVFDTEQMVCADSEEECG